MKKMLPVLMLCIGLFALHNASGQTASQKSLTSISKLDIVIEELDDSARHCGLTPSTIETSVRFILQQSKIRVVSDIAENDGYIYVNVNVMEVGGSCAAAIQSSLFVPVRTVKANQLAIARIWDMGSLLHFSKARFATEVGNRVEHHMKRLVSDWSTVNR